MCVCASRGFPELSHSTPAEFARLSIMPSDDGEVPFALSFLFNENSLIFEVPLHFLLLVD